MIRLEMKNREDMILTEKQQQYHHYHPVKLIYILQAKKYKLLIKEE